MVAAAFDSGVDAHILGGCHVISFRSAGRSRGSWAQRFTSCDTQCGAGLESENLGARAAGWTAYVGPYTCGSNQVVMMQTYAQPGYHRHRYRSTSGLVEYRNSPHYSSYYTSTWSWRVASTSYYAFDSRLTYALNCAQR